uniref:Spondin-1 n=1 Tax=Neogobius melanostomus TaxID=47308 RepID=A0A8C6WH94_9GOBI
MSGPSCKPGVVLLLCLLSSVTCDPFAFTEEPFERNGKANGYCSLILRAQGNRKEISNEFRLRVEGDPESYQPGSTYRVTLTATSPSYFRGFTLIALREGAEGDHDEDYIGTFQVIDEEETQFMTNCPPAVTESTPRRRTSIQVFWTAPRSGYGCVLLKASIVQKRIIYFQDEGPLTKRMCEKAPLYGEVTDRPLLECCACGTAKYRVTFYGNWSEKNHPKDYPRRANHWSALIGASHSKSYVLWEYGGMASDGVKQVSELGSPVKMEEEIRQKGDEVLTVIKMKAQWPAWQPLNVRAAPSAEFSVDRTRHLTSFLTMLGPSPDWNVGLSAEDLCTKECGWVQKVVQDLIPWDAGTDSGVTYESPNKASMPQDKIRPLTSLDHPQSPFYDPEGGAITPVARVVVERIARKGEQCNIVPDNVDDIVADIAQEEKEEDDTPETCIYSNWSPWSACSSATCEKGKRMRQRMLKAQLDRSVPCPHTQDFEPCMGPGCSDEDASTCMMSEWITWSPAACPVGWALGPGSCAPSPSSCLVTEWGEWDPCSATCGHGNRRRERFVTLNPADGSICGTELLDREKCMMPECREYITACYTSHCASVVLLQRLHLLITSKTHCLSAIDCNMSEWSEWSECNKSCGKGHSIRTRMVMMEPQFGGDACPEIIQRRKCKVRKCTRGQANSDEKKRRREQREKRRSKQGRTEGAAEHPGCRMRPWSSWTECTKLCGGGIQERLMTVKQKFKSAQLSSCKDRKEIRACNVHPC